MIRFLKFHRSLVIPCLLLAMGALNAPANAGTSLPSHWDASQVVQGNGLDLRTIYRFANQGRGKFSCEYSDEFAKMLCVTDALSDDWSTRGTRLIVIGFRRIFRYRRNAQS